MDRELRIARNQAIARDSNEGIKDVESPAPDEKLRLSCECGYLDCSRMIEISFSEYEDVRSDPLTFAVVADHVIPDVEDVVEANERFTVVRKRQGPAADLVRDRDPRN